MINSIRGSQYLILTVSVHFIFNVLFLALRADIWSSCLSMALVSSLVWCSRSLIARSIFLVDWGRRVEKPRQTRNLKILEKLFLYIFILHLFIVSSLGGFLLKLNLQLHYPAL